MFWIEKSADNDLKNLRDEVATLSGDLRRKNEGDTMNRATVKLRRKLDEHTAELQLKLSTFKLLICHNPNSCNYLLLLFFFSSCLLKIV